MEIDLTVADPFIRLANDEVDKGYEPEEIGNAMLYGTARYMAFLMKRSQAHGQGGKDEHIDTVIAAFRDMIDHHLGQIPDARPPHSNGEDRNEDHAPVESVRGEPEAENIFESEAGPMFRGVASIDVAVTSYLRGAGNGELADSLVLNSEELRQGPDWNVAYAKRIYKAFDDGHLSPDIAITVIAQLLTLKLLEESTKGYVADPEISEDARAEWIELFSSTQMPKLATMMRKNHSELRRRIERGEDLLFGLPAQRLRDAYYKHKAQHH